MCAHVFVGDRKQHSVHRFAADMWTACLSGVIVLLPQELPCDGAAFVPLNRSACILNGYSQQWKAEAKSRQERIPGKQLCLRLEAEVT